MAKNDIEVTIPAGHTLSEHIPIPRDRIVVPPGQLKDDEGDKVKSKNAPAWSVVSVDVATSQIVLEAAHDEDLVFTVRDNNPDKPA